METWKKYDLFGRSIILIAIVFQLTALGVLQDIRQRGDIAYIMENQMWIAVMVKRLNGSGDKNEIANDVVEAYKNITLFSEREKSFVNNEIFWSNIVFVSLFSFGSILTVFSRHMELRKI